MSSERQDPNVWVRWGIRKFLRRKKEKKISAEKENPLYYSHSFLKWEARQFRTADSERFRRTRPERLSASAWEAISAQKRKSTDWQWRGEPEFTSGNKQTCLEAENPWSRN